MMRLATATALVAYCALMAGAPMALADITVAGVNVGGSHTIVGGDVIDYGGNAVQVTDPGALTMTGGDVSSAGSTGEGIYMTGGTFNMTDGDLSGGTATGYGLAVNAGGTATIGGTATLRGGTDSSGTGSGLFVNGGDVTVNAGTFYGGGNTGGALTMHSGQLDVYGGTFHVAVNNPGNGVSLITGGELNFYGGNFLYDLRATGTAEVNIYNGQFDEEIHIFDDSTTTIFGSDFLVDDVPILVGDLPYLVTDDTATIDVTYLDSSTESISINRFSQGQGTVVLTNVPEPTSAAALLVMGGIALLRRRR